MATVVTRVLRIEPIEASRQLATDLVLLPGDPVLHLERLRLVDGAPIVLESAWLPLALFPGLEHADVASRTLYDVLREDFGREGADFGLLFKLSSVCRTGEAFVVRDVGRLQRIGEE